jgi:hypothetical protein
MILLEGGFEIKDADSGGNKFARLFTVLHRFCSSEPENTDDSICLNRILCIVLNFGEDKG